MACVSGSAGDKQSDRTTPAHLVVERLFGQGALLLDREGLLIIAEVELRHIRAFLAVSEELHFGKAARRLHIAQPAVSQLIRALEVEFGVMLFERTSRRVALTSAGELFLDEARDLLARHERVIERMGRIRAGVAGEVGVGLVPALPPISCPPC